MEIILRAVQFFVKIIFIVFYPFLYWWPSRRNDVDVLPPIRNPLLTLNVTQLIDHLKTRKLKSKDLVRVYIERINEVNPYINAVVEHRFENALLDAARCDQMINSCSLKNINGLFKTYPLLGIPYTVKESCGVKGMSHVVGSLNRLQKNAQFDCVPVEHLRSAGAIILLVSANPEYCSSIETDSLTHGRCLNPYKFSRTSGGSSGGEGALNGSGASVFGIGSDFFGSIRIPCLFNGLFGHKPTGGLISTRGHFPNSTDSDYVQYLQMGPITRFGSDLSLLLQIMIGAQAASLNLLIPVDIKTIRIFYSYGFDGLNGFLHQSVSSDIKSSITKAVNYLKNNGIFTKQAKIELFRNSTEISLSAITRLKKYPYLMRDDYKPPSVINNLRALAKSLFVECEYTKEGLMFELIRSSDAFMGSHNVMKYKKETNLLKREITNLLGSNGVLFFPTLHVNTIAHNGSLMTLWGIDYCLLFNILGLPCTSIPMGLNKNGLPVGFQVVAAPKCDRLCLQIAKELEKAFGGWQPPTRHAF